MPDFFLAFIFFLVPEQGSSDLPVEGCSRSFYRLKVPSSFAEPPLAPEFWLQSGGYLVWLWLREGKPLWNGITRAFILFLYGVVATLQPQNFARVYATYGGFFIVRSLLWAYKLDGYQPDRYDIVGASIALLGVCIIYFMPRG